MTFHLNCEIAAAETSKLSY